MEDEVIDKLLLQLAILIKTKNQPTVSVLSVIPLMKRPKINIIKEKRRIASPFKHGRCLVETRINYVSTIDQNIGSGIAHTSREVMANLVLLPWPGLRLFSLTNL